MSDKSHDFGNLVCIYAQLLPRIREAAKRRGYAIAIHGSMYRDLDLLAVPWIDGADSAEELIEDINTAVGGFVFGDLTKRGGISQPTMQPHGRRSWNICWGGKAFIDISVMPLRASCPKCLAAIPDDGVQKVHRRPRAEG